MTAHATRHPLDDPLADRGLFAIGAVIQLWSTYFMWALANWAYGDPWLALINVLMYDALALLTARIGANPVNGTRKTGARIRGFAWTIAGLCFASTFAGVIASHFLLDEADPDPAGHQMGRALLRSAFGSGVVLLLLAAIVLRVRMKAYRDRVVAQEREAEARRRRMQEAAERRERDERERREREEAERRAAEARQLELERERAEQARLAAEVSQNETPLPECVYDLRELPPDSDEWKARRDALPGDTKLAKGKALVLAHWDRGRAIPTAAQIDQVVSGRRTRTGDLVLKELRQDGHLRPTAA